MAMGSSCRRALADWRRALLTDPQTSGGLLVACAAERAGAICATIVAEGYSSARIIGSVGSGAPGSADRLIRYWEPLRAGDGGREWESNPPGTGSLPHSDLKSERPTRDDSPPSACGDESTKGPNKSSRCLSIRRRSPRRTRDAVAIEEFEDLNRDLAAIGDAVAELGRDEFAARCSGCHFADDGHHFVRRRAQEEMVLRHFVGPAHSPGQLEDAPDVAFRPAGRLGNVAHPAAAETAPPRPAAARSGPRPSRRPAPCAARARPGG